MSRRATRCKSPSRPSAALLAAALVAGCGAPPPVPTPAEIFAPAPGHNFRASTGEVRIQAITERTVCFTTDGSLTAGRHGACQGDTPPRLDPAPMNPYSYNPPTLPTQHCVDIPDR